ncbi:MAG: hypothetical protein KIT09_17610 [Bryobacteraceae bacterium]|nr:hypothetical protein [Bryobacteraceae bacterium]
MDTNGTLLLVMAGAVVVSALALVIMVILLGAMAKAMSSLKKTVDKLIPRAESVLETAQTTLTDSRKQIADITTKSTEILDLTRSQLKKTDDFLAETTARARIQLDRVELVVDDTLSRVHETVVVLNKGVLRPLKELSGLASGVRAALNHLLRGGRPSVAQATTDEEMFI